MKRFISSTLCAIFIIVFVSGCTQIRNKNKFDGIETTTITDCIGREVEIPKNIERIACLYAVSGHVVTMLGEGDRIVAVNGGLKRDKVLTKICPTIQDALMPKVSGNINIEELAKANPDVVFIDIQDANVKGETKKFNKLGIPYLVIDFNNVEGQQNMVKMIGKAIGKEDKAEKYIEFYNQCISTVSEKTDKILKEGKKRVYHSVNEATRTDAPNTLPADWMKIAGLINVSIGDELKFTDNKYFASLEQILMWNPDYILVNEDGVDEYIRTKDQWKNLNAVKNDKVFLLPNGVSRWGHPTSIETPLAILWTAATIYPDHFEDIDMKQITMNFYKDFFNYELTDDEADSILAGKGMREPKK